MRTGFLLVILLFCAGVMCFAQSDTVVIPKTDSLAAIGQHYADSVLARNRFVEDSLSMGLILKPDSLRRNQFVDSLLKNYGLNGYLFKTGTSKLTYLKQGKPRHRRDDWVLVIVIALVIFAAVLNQAIGKDIVTVISAFYSQRALAKINKEENLLNSWTFICLFALFGFTIGLYIYQVISYSDMSFNVSGLQLFLTLSIMVIAFFLFKILLLRVIGFVFDIRRLVREYVSVLYLTYFNISFIFLPVVISFTLLSANQIPYLFWISILMAGAILLVQYFRTGFNIISNFKLHKIYLIIYLCALEFCPILILIKALNI